MNLYRLHDIFIYSRYRMRYINTKNLYIGYLSPLSDVMEGQILNNYEKSKLQ